MDFLQDTEEALQSILHEVRRRITGHTHHLIGDPRLVIAHNITTTLSDHGMVPGRELMPVGDPGPEPPQVEEIPDEH